MITDGLRQGFLDYFAKNGHRVVKSSSLVPTDDPTILFTNAGMNQFKHVFTGLEKKDFARAVSCQKCMRAGGKHNDLENVGYTARHHTFFEMLGNFSFGDYFKKEAIHFAWEYVTKELALPKERLYVSVYKDDEDAFKLWNKVAGLDSKRVFRMGQKDNFWAMGDTGPCGPCSEIFYDQGKEVGCGKRGCSPECDCDRHLEIWNLVFMEFDRDQSGKMEKLPKPCIDTGMGLERVSAVKHGVLSNYDIDVFKPIIAHLSDLSSKQYSKDGEDTKVSMRASSDQIVSMRAIADHIRASTFLISEGIVPSNEGRGYVLRRIVRRAMRHGNMLGIRDAFLYRLVDDVVGTMGGAYPELKSEANSVKTIIKSEEESFLRTLSRGIEIVESEVEKLKKGKGAKGAIFPGEKAFDLYATYGFPLDLTEDALKKHHLKVDVEAFNSSFDEHRSKAKGSFRQEEKQDLYDRAAFAKIPPTKFEGYETLRSEGCSLLKKTASANGSVFLAFDRTPFYAESGGQTGDKGWITAGVLKVEVTWIEKGPSGVFIHHGRVLKGELKEGGRYDLEVDKGKRASAMRNHTATHLLHKALKDNLGDHVKQSGSLVEPERLRFDFSHTSAIPRDTLRKIEDDVNAKILENLAVKTEEMTFDKAKGGGAVALFGEKYGDTVRVISVPGYSTELCGGTHVARTGEIGCFKILTEGSIASGIRRIEAVTGTFAVAEHRKTEDILGDAAAILKSRPEEVSSRVEKALSRVRDLEKRLESGAGQDRKAVLDGIVKDAIDLGGVRVLSSEVDVENPRALRDMADKALDKLGSGIVVLGTKSGERAFLAAKVSKDLTSKYSAKLIIQGISGIIGGGGGGKDEIAEAGGSKPENLKEALRKVLELIR